MSDAVVMHCSKCGAPLPIVPEQADVTCGACSTTTLVPAELRERAAAFNGVIAGAHATEERARELGAFYRNQLVHGNAWITWALVFACVVTAWGLLLPTGIAAMLGLGPCVVALVFTTITVARFLGVTLRAFSADADAADAADAVDAAGPAAAQAPRPAAPCGACGGVVSFAAGALSAVCPACGATATAPQRVERALAASADARAADASVQRQERERAAWAFKPTINEGNIGTVVVAAIFVLVPVVIGIVVVMVREGGPAALREQQRLSSGVLAALLALAIGVGVAWAIARWSRLRSQLRPRL